MCHLATLALAALIVACFAAGADAAPASPSAAPGATAAAAGDPIRLHPDNPHYFLWRGKPTVLVTSAEHYGAVLNLDFDYVKYLDELARTGQNLTRTFAGTYREIPGSFKITGNPLAPAPNRYIAPWARGGEAGYFDGGNKFDLTKWDEAYFARLKDFLGKASERGVVVELVLFCPMYDENLWKACPMNAANNTSGVGNLPKDKPYTLQNGPLMDVQLAVTRKIVTECNAFDNVYFEICNEPYFGGVTLEWQKKIADAIVAAERGLPKKHLIAQNIANGSCVIKDPNPDVSVFNFHYCSPPDAVKMNWGLNRVIADDETGFKGSADVPYRPDAWDFLMAGGAVYSNLDYSFRPGSEDGTAKPEAPGGGGRALRQSMKALRDFMESFDFVRMTPDYAIVKGGLPEKATARALVEKGRQVALFLRGGKQATLVLDLPAGTYAAEWVNTRDGKVEKAETVTSAGGDTPLVSPAYDGEIALRVKRKP
jgi:hypothetical protein